MSYTEDELNEIWKKAIKSTDLNEEKGFRKDMCGAWILRSKYGEEGDYGWEVDHIYPKSKAEEKGILPELYNDTKNLQPLHWENNGAEGKGDDYPSFNSKIGSEGVKNVEKVNKMTIPTSKQAELEKLFNQ